MAMDELERKKKINGADEDGDDTDKEPTFKVGAEEDDGSATVEISDEMARKLGIEPAAKGDKGDKDKGRKGPDDEEEGEERGDEDDAERGAAAGKDAKGEKGKDADRTDDRPEGRKLSRRQRQRLRQQDTEERLARLETENRDLREAHATTAKRLGERELADLDREIGASDAAIKAARDKRRAAREANDFNAADDAEDALRAAERKKDRLEETKEAARRAPAAERDEAGGESTDESTERRFAAAVRPFYSAWAARNPGFNPRSNDAETLQAKAIERELAAEGSDPRGTGHWNELDKRLKKAAISFALDEERDDRGEPDEDRGSERRPRTRTSTVVASGNGSGARPAGVKIKIPGELRKRLEQGDYTPQDRDKILADYVKGVRDKRYVQV